MLKNLFLYPMLLGIIFLNLNVIFGFGLVYSRNLYYLVELLMLIGLVSLAFQHSRALRIPRRLFFGSLIVLSGSMITSLFYASDLLYHWFYISVLMFKFLFLFLLIHNKFQPPNLVFLKSMIRAALYVSLLSSLVHLSFSESRAGWAWPINISIQEIVLLLLFLSLLLLSPMKKEWPIVVLMLILFYFRSSGKTAFFLTISIPSLMWLMQRFDWVKTQVRVYQWYYFIAFVCLIGYLVFIEYAGLAELFANYRVEVIDDRIDYWKRISLIIEGLFHLTNDNAFLFGSGFGVPNYSQAVDSYLGNTPQVLVLTLFVYGGLVFCFGYFYLIWALVLSTKKAIDLTVDQTNLVSILVFVLITFFTTHEYFNNPFIYASLGVFIITLKSVGKPKLSR